MKKVVFYACTVAALMASAPYAANAANPGVNDVQEVNWDGEDSHNLGIALMGVASGYYELEAQLNTGAGITSADQTVLLNELHKVSDEVDYISESFLKNYGQLYGDDRNYSKTIIDKVKSVQQLYAQAKQKYTQITDYTNLVQDKKDQVAALQALVEEASLFEAAKTQIKNGLTAILNDNTTNKKYLYTTGGYKVDCTDVEGYLSDRAGEKITENQNLDWSAVNTGLAAIQTSINAQQAAIAKAEKAYDLYDRVANDYNAYVNLWNTYTAEFNNSKNEFYNISEKNDDNQYHVLDQKLDDLVSDKNSNNLNDFTDFGQKLQDPSLDYEALSTLYNAISEHEQSFWKLVETIKKAKNFYTYSKNDYETLSTLLVATQALWKVAVPSDEVSSEAKAEYQKLGKDYENLQKKLKKEFDEATIYSNYNTLLSEVGTLDNKVFEYYKKQKGINYGYYVEYREKVNDLMSSINDIRYNVAEVFSSFEDNEALQDFTAEAWDKKRAEALELCTNELTKLNEDLAKGELAFDVCDTDEYDEDFQTITDALNELKQYLEGAEMIYAMSSANKAELESRVTALQEIVKTTLANSVCNDCNEEDEADLKSAANGLVTILSEINDEFYAGNLYNKEAGVSEPDPTKTSYQVIAEKIDAAETSIAAIKDLIVEHKMLQKQNEQLYNNLVKLINNDFNALNAEVMAMEGAGVFAKRWNPETGYNQNFDVQCLDELALAVEDLKLNIKAQSSHSGSPSHSIIDNIDDNYKAIQALKDKYADLKVAIERNNAAKKLMDDKFAELFNAAKEAYLFWFDNYSDATLTDEFNLTWYINYWMDFVDGEYVNGTQLKELHDQIDYYYNSGIAAASWNTVDGLGEELTEFYLNNYYYNNFASLASDRNYLAKAEALNHLNAVKLELSNMLYGTDYDNLGFSEYFEDIYNSYTYDPFVADDLQDLWFEQINGEYGVNATLAMYEKDIYDAYTDSRNEYWDGDALNTIMEDAINIDERNHALGLHQQLNGVSAVIAQLKDEYTERFEAAHHLTNGKTIYSDQEYFTLGFFKKANEGLGNQAQEMFQNVEVLNPYYIRAIDSASEENCHDVNVEVLAHIVTPYYVKANELSFNLVQGPAYPLAKKTLNAGDATVEFDAYAIEVDGWKIKHPVDIAFTVAEPVVEPTVEPEGETESNKLVIRPQFPVDLTYTSKVLVATTDAGEQISFADAQFNVAAGQIEFDLPEGTNFVELPEGFFTFRTGENSIAHSSAKVIAVTGNQTSIEALAAMGEKAQIFDLQGRRASVETLVKGNTYVVNGVKTIVK